MIDILYFLSLTLIISFVIFIIYLLSELRPVVKYNVGDILIEYSGPTVEAWELEDNKHYLVKQTGLKRVLVEVFKDKEHFDKKIVAYKDDYEYSYLRRNMVKL